MKNFALLESLRRWDQFSEPVTLNYDGGKTRYQTFSGFLLTLTMFLLVTIYGLRQLLVMSDHKDFVINSFIEAEGALATSMDGFGKDQRFSVAFAVG